MNQPTYGDRSAVIAYAIAERVPIGATVVKNTNGTTEITVPPPTEETLDIYLEAILLHPDNADLRQDFSFALRKTGHPEAALEQLHEAVRIDPDDYFVHLALARCYGEVHDLAKACQAAKEAVRLLMEDHSIASADSEADARWLLGELLQQSGDLVAARVELSRALVLANTAQSARLITHIQSALDALA